MRTSNWVQLSDDGWVWVAGLKSKPSRVQVLIPAGQAAGFLIACAYPDRIARRRHSGAYQLANGRSANLSGAHYLGKQHWLAIAEVGGIAPAYNR